MGQRAGAGFEDWHALVMRVRHPDDGGCTVRIWDDNSQAPGALAHSGTIDVPSGVLKVSDALQNASAEVPLEPWTRSER